MDENKQNIKDLENQIDEMKSDMADERKKRKRYGLVDIHKIFMH